MSEEKKPEEKPPEEAAEKPGASSGGELTERKEDAQGLTMEQVLQHPVVLEMSARLDTLQRTVKSLPEAIARVLKAAREAERPKGMDIQNPELLTGAPPGKDLIVQNLRQELDKTRKDVGYTQRPTPPPLDPKKKK